MNKHQETVDQTRIFTEEIIKEWEEKEWKITISNREIEIEDIKSLAFISIDIKDKLFWCSHYLTFDLIHLLTKTIRMLEHGGDNCANSINNNIRTKS